MPHPKAIKNIHPPGEVDRPEMVKFYYDETKFSTYLEQLGITYPTLRRIVP